MGGVGPEVERILGGGAVADQGLGMLGPERVDLFAELLQAGDFMVFQWLGEGFAPGLESLEIGRVEVLGDLVSVGGHAGIGQEEVVDFVFATGAVALTPNRIRWMRHVGHVGHVGGGEDGERVEAVGGLFVPGGFGFFPQAAGGVNLAAGTNQAVAAEQLVAEPGHAGRSRR